MCNISLIRRVNEYPTMHYFGILWHTESKCYMLSLTKNSGTERVMGILSIRPIVKVIGHTLSWQGPLMYNPTKPTLGESLRLWWPTTDDHFIQQSKNTVTVYDLYTLYILYMVTAWTNLIQRVSFYCIPKYEYICNWYKILLLGNAQTIAVSRSNQNETYFEIEYQSFILGSEWT